MSEQDRRDAIDEAVTDGIQAATGESGSITRAPLKDRIEADKYLGGKSAAVTPTRGLILTRMSPPGAV